MQVNPEWKGKTFMSHSGFQLSHPEITLDISSPNTSGIVRSLWVGGQKAVATLSLIALLPLLAVLFVIVRLTSQGPFIFKQKRVGQFGVTFDVYKIRTMKRGSESVSALGVNNTSFHVTGIGRILRTLKIDEFPQLWNIARGDMNIVGPRPIPLALDQKLSDEIPGFYKRYDVKPGLTSIGQICINDNLLGDELVADWKIRFEGELHYIRNRSIRYDLLMVLMTTLFVVRKFLPNKKL